MMLSEFTGLATNVFHYAVLILVLMENALRELFC